MFRFRTLASSSLFRRFGGASLVAASAACIVACSGADAGKNNAAVTGSQGGADARFFLPTGEPDNTSAPRIEIDAKGTVHAIYPAYAGGDAYYAVCAEGCAKPDDVKVVHLRTEGTVANAMLALDAEGRPRVLLSTFAHVYYASCDEGCDSEGGWTTTDIIKHDNDREVTGEAFTLDPQGRPRFLMHTYRAYLGIGQKTPETLMVACDADCTVKNNWRQKHIANQMWEGGALRFDKNGGAHVATVATGDGAQQLGGYLYCPKDCEKEASWAPVGLGKAFESETEAVRMKPTISMELTQAGTPRILFMAKDDAGKKNIMYFACDSNCTAESGSAWTAMQLSDHAQLGAGLDLALDAQDHPRFVYTLGYNIVFGRCDEAHCESAGDGWKLTKVEAGSDMPPDQIFLYPNCTVGAWFLHGPSLALTRDGKARVGYQARDISGGVTRPDPTKGSCKAGTDMTFARLALMSHFD
ncbi:MAG: hypothetical protein HOO96_05195 [Polyangiaceae bacterium]|nr:hypothetical protein [Polyangiaceae bacterium]